MSDKELYETFLWAGAYGERAGGIIDLAAIEIKSFWRRMLFRLTGE
jgi:hypothetical protein